MIRLNSCCHGVGRAAARGAGRAAERPSWPGRVPGVVVRILFAVDHLDHDLARLDSRSRQRERSSFGREQCSPHVLARFEPIEEERAAAGDAQPVALRFQADRVRHGADHDGFEPTRDLLDLLNGAAPEVRCSARARDARHLRRQVFGQVHRKGVSLWSSQMAIRAPEQVAELRLRWVDGHRAATSLGADKAPIAAGAGPSRRARRPW